MKHDPSIAVINPGPHRQKRIRKASEDPSVRHIIIKIPSRGGPLSGMPIPPKLKIDL